MFHGDFAMEIKVILRKRNIALAMTMVTFFLFVISSKASTDVKPFFQIAVFFAVIYTALNYVSLYSKCPFCRKAFFYKFPFFSGLSSKCVHCGKGVSDET